MKVCSKCGEEKALEEFHRQKTGKFSRRSQCKSCRHVPRKKRDPVAFFWELKNGAIPKGLQICHHCDNPPCSNPDHLFLGTRSENLLDAARKGRIARKLTPSDVKEIRELLNDSSLLQRQIGKRYGVGRHVISHIKTGRTWSWLK